MDLISPFPLFKTLYTNFFNNWVKHSLLPSLPQGVLKLNHKDLGSGPVSTCF